MHDFWAAVLRRDVHFPIYFVFMIPPDTEYTEALGAAVAKGSLDPLNHYEARSSRSTRNTYIGLLLSKDKKKKKQKKTCIVQSP